MRGIQYLYRITHLLVGHFNDDKTGFVFILAITYI